MRAILRSWLRRSGTKAPRTPPRRQLVLESLEDRTVLSITVPTPGSPGPVTLTGTPQADQFVIRLAPPTAPAGTIEFSDNGGRSFTDAAFGDVTQITVDGRGSSDSLTVDNSNGLVGKAGGLTIRYVGGPGQDQLLLVGNPGGPSIHETYATGPGRGSGTLTSDNGVVSQVISFAGTWQVVDAMTAASLTIDLGRATRSLWIGNAAPHFGLAMTRVQGLGDPDHGLDDTLLGASALLPEPLTDLGFFTPITFANKAHVAVNTGPGNDHFLLTSTIPAAGLTSLTFNGGGGTNMLDARHMPPGVSLTVKNIQHVNPDADGAAFIQELYQERLGRDADDGEVQAWVSTMQQLGNRFPVVAAIELSVEARTQLVRSWYVQYLGREAVNNEEAGWVQELLAGMSEEQVLSAFVSSPEFLLRASLLYPGTSLQESYVWALYRLFLNRDPGAAELVGWLAVLPTAGFQGVALGILDSAEYRQDVVTGYYISLLHRDPDPASLSAWVASSFNLAQIRIGIEASSEYYLDG